MLPTRHSKFIFAVYLVFIATVVVSGCASVDSPGGSIVEAPAANVMEVEGFPFYDKRPNDRDYTVLGFVEIERPAGQKRKRVLADLRAEALAMGGNAIIDLKSVVVPSVIAPSVVGGISTGDFGQYGGAELEEKFRWRGTVVILKQ